MFLALRDMRRSKVRFGLLIVAVGLLIFLTLFLQTLFASLVNSFTGGLRNQSGTVVVFGADARKNLSGSVITPAQQAAINDVPSVQSYGPLGVGAFTVTPAGANPKPVDAFLFGYELTKPGAPTTLTRGRLPQTANEAVVTANVPGFGLGQTVQIVPSSDAVDPLPITIVGEATDLRYSVQTTLFVSYNTFIAARRTANPAAAQQPVFPAAIVVTPNPGISPEQLARTITQTVTGTDALSRAAAAAAQPGVASVNQSFGLLILLTVIVVVMVMAFFFLILTVQKQNAFTLLRAAGASKGYLRRAILIEVVVVLAGGLLCGFVLLALGVLVINQIFPATVNPNAALGYGIFLCVLGFLGALFALARIRKFRPENAANAPALGGLA